MADDINLPNLVSHLNVNLDGLNGTIADASRQGSSVGAALGGGIQNELRGLLAHLPDIPIDANSDEVDRDLARVRQQLDELSNQRIGIDIPIDRALRQINELTPHLQRLGESHPDINVQVSARGTARQLDEILAAARRVDAVDPEINVHVDERGSNRLHGMLGNLATAGAEAGTSIAGAFAKSAAQIGAVVPVAAGAAATLANIAPAAGLAATGIIAAGAAGAALKIGMSGVGDAVKEAFSGDDPKKLAEALAKLSPEARNFVGALQGLKPQLDAIKTSVQDRLFANLDTTLNSTAKATLPVFRSNLSLAAGALNLMARQTLNTVTGLKGPLTQGLNSATRGLYNMSGLPATVVQGLVQIGAAAGPSFERLTKAGGGALDRLSQKLTAAFESGRMQQAIETAIGLIGDLVEVAGNVGSILGSVFSAAQVSGGGFIGTLQKISGSLADAFASPEVQGGLKALFTTMSTVASTVAPLLGQALGVIAPVLEALGPPAQTLIKALGDGLSPIITALGPVLVTAAGAVGSLVEAAAPLLPVVGQLAASLLPALTPLLEAAQVVFEAMAPVVGDLAGILQETLAPILAQLPALIEPLAELMGAQLVAIFQLLGETLVEVGPSLVQLGVSAGQLLVAVTPLIEIIAQLTTQMLQQLVPALVPVIGFVGDLAAVFAGSLSATITNVVIPAVQIISDLLRGDFTGATNTAKQAVQNMADRVTGLLSDLVGRARSALSSLGSALVGKMNEAGAALRSAASKKIDEAKAQIGRLPSAARAALGDLSGVLSGAGASLISGFVAGIRSNIDSVRSTLQGLTGKLTDWKGPKQKDAKILTPAGRLLIEGFIKGINGTTAKLKSTLNSITKALPANVRSGYGKTLKRATAELEKLVNQRDSVIKKLAGAQKKLDDLVKARNKAASDITSGILQEANITTGHADVNSVSAITVGLQQALKATQAFQANIAKLKKSGLRSDLLQQVADAGVDAGGATAAALAKATPAELKKINDLQAQLAKSATATGNTVGDALYSAGIRAAQGLVAGLKSQEAAIEKQMRKIAEGMLATTKKVHKTKSPSRAFHDIGVMDGEGLRNGFASMASKIRDTFRSVAGGALDVASGLNGALSLTPSAGQLAAVYAGSGGGDTYNTFYQYGDEATPEGMLRALSWQGLVGRK